MYVCIYATADNIPRKGRVIITDLHTISSTTMLYDMANSKCNFFAIFLTFYLQFFQCQMAISSLTTTLKCCSTSISCLTSPVMSTSISMPEPAASTPASTALMLAPSVLMLAPSVLMPVEPNASTTHLTQALANWYQLPPHSPALAILASGKWGQQDNPL